MSVSTKRRYITNKVESEYYTPVEGDIIAQVKNTRGNNLHEIEDENGETYVASMPSKFRKAIWIRRGQFVVLRPIEEGDKVKAEIEHVLDEENILYIRSMNKWPARFEEQARMMTRDAKRGGKGDTMIDDDMLPPSDSDEYESSEEHSTDGEEGDVSDDESDESAHDRNQYNPNRDKAPTSS
ncbi:putative translation initiation factor eIF-1A [Cooperia oncophora]